MATIAWDNVLLGSTVTASAEASDGYAQNAIDGTTYDFWKVSASASIEFELDEAKTIQCVAIAAHTLSTDGAVATFQYWDSAWVDLAVTAVTQEDRPLFVLTKVISTDKIKVTVSAGCSIGVLWAGPILTMQRGLNQGHRPVVFGRDIDVRSNRSQNGDLLGTSVTRRGARDRLDFKNLKASWVRNNLTDFVDHFNAGKAFWWAWNIEKYPGDVAYCWREADEARLENTGPRDYMSLTAQMRCYVDGVTDVIRAMLTSHPYHLSADDELDLAGGVDVDGWPISPLDSAPYHAATDDELQIAGAIVSIRIEQELSHDEEIEVAGKVAGGYLGTDDRVRVVHVDLLDVAGDVTDGSLKEPTEVAANDELDVSGDISGGELIEPIVYNHYDAESLDVAGDISGGTLV